MKANKYNPISPKARYLISQMERDIELAHEKSDTTYLDLEWEKLHTLQSMNKKVLR